jgi:hypothetical protein
VRCSAPPKSLFVAARPPLRQTPPPTPPPHPLPSLKVYFFLGSNLKLGCVSAKIFSSVSIFTHCMQAALFCFRILYLLLLPARVLPFCVDWALDRASAVLHASCPYAGCVHTHERKCMCKFICAYTRWRERKEGEVEPDAASLDRVALSRLQFALPAPSRS